MLLRFKSLGIIGVAQVMLKVDGRARFLYRILSCLVFCIVNEALFFGIELFASGMLRQRGARFGFADFATDCWPLAPKRGKLAGGSCLRNPWRPPNNWCQKSIVIAMVGIAQYMPAFHIPANFIPK
ncbi:MAG: hypothetical protein L0H70_06670 [Xanthomonadales bacterium]|nr:hypothetical protein [Xanthomonadales bacterium]